MTCSGDRDPSILQRLSKGLERCSRELRQLVKEEHAVVREHHLADPTSLGATDHARRGDRVVRRPEGALARQLLDAVAQEALDPGDLDRLLATQRRQDRGEPVREHRLAGPRGAAEQDAVSARRRDHHRPDRVPLPADLAEIHVTPVGHRSSPAGAGRARRRIGVSSVQHAHGAREPLDRERLDSLDQLSLAGCAACEHQSAQARTSRRMRHRERALGGAHAAVERQLAEQGVAAKSLRSQLPARREHSAGQGEIETRPLLAHISGREVCRYAPRGKLKAGVEDRRAHALARLADCGIGEAHDREAGQPRTDVDLHGDVSGLQPLDREGVCPRQHCL